MTYLQLLQRVLLLLRAGNERLSTPPTDVVDLTGVQYEAAQWVAMATEDIQNERPDWLFMRKQAQVQVQQGSRVFNIRGALTDLVEIIPSVGDGDARFITSYTNEQRAEIKCYYFPWEVWRGSAFDRQPRSQSSAPVRCTIDPSGNLVLDPEPSQAMTLVFDYRRRAVPLVDKDSTPEIPAEHHVAIVYWAVYRYYCLTRDSTAEFRAKAKIEFDREWQKLVNRQTPEITMGCSA